jgi:hypothetical protein
VTWLLIIVAAFVAAVLVGRARGGRTHGIRRAAPWHGGS